MTVKLELYEWRGIKDWSQQQLADAAGLSRNFISQLERGEVDAEKVSLATLQALARALEIPLGQMVEITDADAWAHGFSAGWDEAVRFYETIRPVLEKGRSLANSPTLAHIGHPVSEATGMADQPTDGKERA